MAKPKAPTLTSCTVNINWQCKCGKKNTQVKDISDIWTEIIEDEC